MKIIYTNRSSLTRSSYSFVITRSKGDNRVRYLAQCRFRKFLIPWLWFSSLWNLSEHEETRSSEPSVAAWCNFHIASERFQWNLTESFIIPSPLSAWKFPNQILFAKRLLHYSLEKTLMFNLFIHILKKYHCTFTNYIRIF